LYRICEKILVLGRDGRREKEGERGRKEAVKRECKEGEGERREKEEVER
jgi:hypothetical protein